LGCSAQDHAPRHNERTGGVVAGHIEHDGPASGGTGGVDRALNDCRVVGVTIAFGSIRIHRWANTHGSCDGCKAWAENPGQNDYESGLYCHPPQRSVTATPDMRGVYDGARLNRRHDIPCCGELREKPVLLAGEAETLRWLAKPIRQPSIP